MRFKKTDRHKKRTTNYEKRTHNLYASCDADATQLDRKNLHCTQDSAIFCRHYSALYKCIYLFRLFTL